MSADKYSPDPAVNVTTDPRRPWPVGGSKVDEAPSPAPMTLPAAGSGVSPSLRPAGAYVHGVDGAVVIVTGRLAAWLLARTDLARLRVEVRGQDPEIDAGLIAITEAAHRWRSSACSAKSGTEFDVQAEVPARLELMTTIQVADVLGCSTGYVRRLARTGALPATWISGRRQFSRRDVEDFARNRAA